MLLSDPLASPYLPTLGATLAAIFGGSLAALAVAARGHLSALRRSTLFVRWRTWVLIAPLFSLAVLAGPLAVALLAAGLALQGSRELAPLLGLGATDRRLLSAAAIGAPLACLAQSPAAPIAVLVVLPLVGSLPALLEQDVDCGVSRATRQSFALLYLPGLLSLLVLLARDPRSGPGLLLTLATSVALSDVGAFVFGRAFGRRPLVPLLSPNKTRAGLAGNVLGAVLGVALMRPLLPAALPPVPLALLVAVGAVWGDLLESLLKRGAAVKDAGAWLPGFGGLLDRIDSLLVALPLVFVLVETLP